MDKWTRMARRWTVAAAAACMGTAHAADPYPSRPVRIIVPLPPGGGIDTTARFVAPLLSAKLGQPVIVENRPGAAGIVGTAFAARAPGDGYTLLLGNTGANGVSETLVRDLPYRTERDFAPITIVTTTPLFVVVPAGSANRNLADLIRNGKSGAGDLNFGSVGVGSFTHIAGEMFNIAAGTRYVNVPYQGGAQQLLDTVSGRVSFAFAGGADIIPHVNGGRLRALAIAGNRRSAVAPDVPTMAEAGLPGFVAQQWYGMMAPAQTPPAVIDRLYAELAEILARPAFRGHFEALAVEVTPTPPPVFREIIRADIAKYAEVIAKAGIRGE